MCSDVKEMEKNFNLFNEMLDMMDFDLIHHGNTEENKFSLRDRTGANWGKIESDNFDNLEEIIDRLDRYVEDYFENDLVEQLEIKEDYKNYEELVELAKKRENCEGNKFCIAVLEMVANCSKFSYFRDLEKIKKYVDYER